MSDSHNPMDCSLPGSSVCEILQARILERVAISFSGKCRFFFFFHKFLFSVALGLHCCAWSFSSCCEWGPLFVAVHESLTAVASLVEHRLLGAQASAVAAHRLSNCGTKTCSCGTGGSEHRLRCSAACRIFLDQGLNPCPSHW